MVTSILNNAASGLRLTQTLLGTTSRNISNAATEGYTRKTQQAVTGPAGGVNSGPVRRATDDLLTQQLHGYTASRSASETLSSALDRIDRLAGDPQRADSVSGRISAVADSLQQLATDPVSPTNYQEVVGAARSLATTYRNTFYELNSVSQDARNAIPDDVATANQLIGRISDMNRQVASITATGSDNTDLLDKRDGLAKQLSEIMNVRTYTDSRNVLHVHTADNKLLADEGSYPLSTDLSGNVLAGTQRVFNVGGRIGANQEIFNRIVPSITGQLDDLAGRLTEGLDGAGVPLFNDGGTTPFDPSSPTQGNGFSGRITLNPAVDADATLLRGGAAVPVGDTSRIVAARAALIEDDQTFTAAGLPGTAPLTLSAATLVGNIASRAATARDDVEGQQVSEDLVRSRISDISDVNIDDEMSTMLQLQTAYAANARVMQSAQSMMDELLNIVR